LGPKISTPRSLNNSQITVVDNAFTNKRRNKVIMYIAPGLPIDTPAAAWNLYIFFCLVLAVERCKVLNTMLRRKKQGDKHDSHVQSWKS
jgi:hypothetical protein